MAKRRVAISLHNLSSSMKLVKRAGIQQVVFEIARKTLTTNHQSYEFIPIFHLPLCNPAKTPMFRPTHFNASNTVLKATLEEIGLSVESVVKTFPFTEPLLENDIASYEKRCIEEIASCDIFFEPALADIRNVVDAAKKLNPKLVSGICVHDMVPMVYPEYIDDHMRGWFSIQYIECINSVDFCVCVSRNTAIDTQRYMASYAPSSSQIFYNSLPTPARGAMQNSSKKTDVLATAYPQLQGKRIALSVATIEPRKNISLVLQAFKKFTILFPTLAKNSLLVLVGAKGWEDHTQLDRLIKDLNSNILVTGYLTSELLEAFYQSAEVCLTPSHYEGFGIPVADAIARGPRVITSINSSLPEASRLGASYTDPANSDELACLLAAAFQQGAKEPPTDFTNHEYNSNWDDYNKSLIKIFDSIMSREGIYPTNKFKPNKLNIGFDISQESLLLRAAKKQHPNDQYRLQNYIAFFKGLRTTLDFRADQALISLYQSIEDQLANGYSLAPSENLEYLYFDELSHFILSSRAHINSNPALTSALKKGLRLVSLIQTSETDSLTDECLISKLQWSDLLLLESDQQLKHINEQTRPRCLVCPEAFKPSSNQLEYIEKLIGDYNFA